MTVVFLDRDGVINENRPDHVKSWDEFRFLPGALDAVARLTRSQVHVFVITNQAVINRRLVPVDVIEDVQRRMLCEIEAHGGHVVDIAYCPHRPDELCACRKPRPGLILDLAAKHRLNLRDAVVIGDALTDIEASVAAGCRSILVLTGRGREQLGLVQAARHTCAVAANLPAAVDLVLAGEAARQQLSLSRSRWPLSPTMVTVQAGRSSGHQA